MSNHETGYGKPPTHAQFKPGQSGNPKGRPKGSSGLRQAFIEAMTNESNTQVTVNENGHPVLLSKIDLAAKQVMNKAAAGDIKSITFVLNLIRAEQESHVCPPPTIIIDDIR